jgi:hypothetical protein
MGREMTEANLATARKIILCAGLLVATLLFLFPQETKRASVFGKKQG